MTMERYNILKSKVNTKYSHLQTHKYKKNEMRKGIIDFCKTIISHILNKGFEMKRVEYVLNQCELCVCNYVNNAVKTLVWGVLKTSGNVGSPAFMHREITEYLWTHTNGTSLQILVA